MNRNQPKPKNYQFIVLWLLIFALAVAWRAQNLDAFGLANDEGAHLMWAKLAVEGYPLYETTRAVQSPLFLEWIGWAFRLGGMSIQAGRWAILIPGFSLLAFGLSWLAYQSGGRVAALTALILSSISPLIFRFSRLVMAEIPATALAVISVALIVYLLKTDKDRWLLLSGLALGLSMITKALNPFVIAPIGLLILLRRREKSWLFKAGGLWSIGFLLPLILLPFIYEPKALYEQMILFRSQLRAAIPGSWAETWAGFQLFFTTHWGFWLLAVGRLIWGKDQEKNIPQFPIWLIWLGAGIGMLAWHTPLFAHHFITLLPPLILLGADFVAKTVHHWRQTYQYIKNPDLGIASLKNHSSIINGLSLVIIVGAALNIPAMNAANRHTAAIVTGGREAQALKLLQETTLPNDFLMGDSQLLIFLADRRTPPPLGDVALVAIKAGLQDSERMIRLTEQYQAPAVVQWSLRLPWLPDYLAWVEKNYLARRKWDNDHLIYFVPRHPVDEALPNERRIRLGESILLRGWDKSKMEAGETLDLIVYWEARTALTTDYTIFTQLLDPNGQLVASWDSQPLGGHFPTTQWPSQEIITDRISLPLPAHLSAGEYRLITGMYRLETMERLSTITDTDFIELTKIALPD